MWKLRRACAVRAAIIIWSDLIWSKKSIKSVHPNVQYTKYSDGFMEYSLRNTHCGPFYTVHILFGLINFPKQGLDRIKAFSRLISVSSLLSHVSCLHSHVSCLMQVSCLPDSCQLANVPVSCPLSRPLLFYSMYLLLISCFLSYISCLLSPVSPFLSDVSCLNSPVSHLLSHVSCLTSSVSCLISPVSRLLSSFSCLISPVSHL